MERDKLQLLGTAAMLTAGKVCEIHPPGVEDYEYICDHTYPRSAITAFELHLCSALDFRLHRVTSYDFVHRFAGASGCDDRERNLVLYLVEGAAATYKSACCDPRAIAAGAVYLARKMLRNGPAWTPTLEHYTGYKTTDPAFREAVLRVREVQWEGGERGRAAWVKYKARRFGEVALRITTSQR